MENWRSSSKKRVPNQAIAILFLHSGSFLPFPGFSGPVIKRKSCLQNSGNGLADRLYLWGFVSSSRGFLSTTWVILGNWPALCKADFCRGGGVWEWLGGIKSESVLQSIFSDLLQDMGKDVSRRDGDRAGGGCSQRKSCGCFCSALRLLHLAREARWTFQLA